MLAEWLKQRDRRKVQEAREAGLAEARANREEARKEGQRRLHRQWQAWYERQQAALRDGRPFTEPPPAGPDSLGENGQ